MRNSFWMVRKNCLSYAKLSITVVLSFVLLFGYMALIDTDLFNRYAFISSLPPEVVGVYSYDAERHNAFLKQINDHVPDAKTLSVFSIETFLDYYSFTTETDNSSLHPAAECVFIPSDIKDFYYYEDTISGIPFVQPLQMVSGRKTFSLEENEVIINQSFYQALMQKEDKPPEYLYLTIHWKDETGAYFWKLKIVGVCQDLLTNTVVYKDNVISWFGVNLYLSRDVLQKMEIEKIPQIRYMSTIVSNDPVTVISIANNLQQTVEGVALAQREANRIMRTETKSKGVTAILMFILLSINLYSSFSNVLQTRNYEIGVRRALGASQKSIMQQFLYEAFIVLGTDTILSGIIVLDGMLLYKAFYAWKSGQVWMIYIDKSSWYIFCVSSLILIVSFSLIFGYKATTIEIVDYLKKDS